MPTKQFVFYFWSHPFNLKAVSQKLRIIPGSFKCSIPGRSSALMSPKSPVLDSTTDWESSFSKAWISSRLAVRSKDFVNTLIMPSLKEDKNICYSRKQPFPRCLCKRYRWTSVYVLSFLHWNMFRFTKQVWCSLIPWKISKCETIFEQVERLKLVPSVCTKGTVSLLTFLHAPDITQDILSNRFKHKIKSCEPADCIVS